MKNKTNLLLISLLALTIGYIYIAMARPFNFSPNSTQNQSAGAITAQLQATLDKIPTQAGKKNFLKQSNNLTQKVDPELVDLDSQIISCEANVDAVLSSSHTYGGSCIAQGGTLTSITGKYMGGQCCGTMTDLREYNERLEKLQAYKSMPDIPLDPMHTPIDMAKRWIDYDNATTLTPEEQKIYDQAYAISKEKPCCCKCWHYFVDEGIAKKMIKDKTFNAQQIADFWDASEICGT